MASSIQPGFHEWEGLDKKQQTWYDFLTLGFLLRAFPTWRVLMKTLHLLVAMATGVAPFMAQAVEVSLVKGDEYSYVRSVSNDASFKGALAVLQKDGAKAHDPVRDVSPQLVVRTLCSLTVVPDTAQIDCHTPAYGLAAAQSVRETFQAPNGDWSALPQVLRKARVTHHDKYVARK